MKNLIRKQLDSNGKSIFKTYLEWILALGFIFASYSAVAQPSVKSCTPWTQQFYHRTDLVIANIEVDARDIFDLNNPKESKKIHHIANKLHVSTKPKVIRRQLLFVEGDILKKRILDESARLIRANRYIKDVEITPYQVCGKRVDIKVITSDKWTLTPGVSFGKSGGKNKSGIEFQENNLLGLGKGLALNYKNGAERHETVLSYSDEQLFGSRLHLLAEISSNSDGNGYQLDLSRPYYSLDSRRAWGTKNSSIQQENSIYSKGDVVDKVEIDDISHSGFYGWSKGLQNDSVSRFKVGWNYSRTQYGKLLPITQSYPWFEYEYIKEQFTTRTNFKSMGEVEDVPLGLNYSVEVGLLSTELGSSENQLRLATKVSKGFEFKNSLVLLQSDLTSYIGDGPLQGETLNLKSEFFTFNEQGSDLYFSGNFRLKNNLQLGEQLLLGGENGLRGYPSGYQDGTKSIVLTAEKRFHYDWYPYQLAKFGAVVFADAGTAWGDGNKSEVLTDVGFGLRIIPTRTSKTKALHLDFAFPLDGGKNVDDVQISLKTQQNF